MIPTFASPWLLWGLLSLGALAVVYLLRMRSRRRIVSSLLLWVDERTTDTGGRVWQKLRTPLAFFLELLVLLLLVLAAADPLWPRDGSVPVVVVLDNSYSMRAAPNSAEEPKDFQELAREKLASMLKKETLNAQVILAGRHPILMNRRFNSEKSIELLMPQWTCMEPTADLGSAITLARQVGGLGARVLVITDQPSPDHEEPKEAPKDKPTEEPQDPQKTGVDPSETNKPETQEKSQELNLQATSDQVRWISVGDPLPNLAIVSAVRRDAASSDEKGRAMVEIANLSAKPITSELAVRLGEQHSARSLNIKPGQIQRFSIPITNNQAELELTLPPDALELDNRAVLLPESVAKLRVRVEIKDKKLSEAVRRALKASGRAKITDVHPQIRFTDSQPKPRADCWDVAFLDAKDSKSILGPFVLEKTHELLEGITLEGIVMCQSKTIPMPGRPLVTSDDMTLVSLDTLPDERGRLFIQFGPDKTTLLDSLDFPALVWNLLRWRESGLPELCRPNVRLGEPVRLRLLKGRKEVELVTPDNKTVPLSIFDTATIFSCDTAGRHTVRIDAGGEKERELPVSANVLFRDESNLQRHRSGEWGKWKVTDKTRRDYLSVITPLLLLALVAWVLHGRLIRGQE